MKSIDACSLLWRIANLFFDSVNQRASVELSIAQLVDLFVFHKLVQITIACVIEIAVLALRPSDNENRGDADKIRKGLFLPEHIFDCDKKGKIPCKGIEKNRSAVLKAL